MREGTKVDALPPGIVGITQNNVFASASAEPFVKINRHLVIVGFVSFLW